MNDHLRAHAKHMVIGGVGILLLLLVIGVGWSQALTWALLLACPVGMIGMMWFMGHQSGGVPAHHGASGASGDHGSHGDHRGHGSHCDHADHADHVPQQRVGDPSATAR
jgi:hypothetical protein